MYIIKDFPFRKEMLMKVNVFPMTNFSSTAIAWKRNKFLPVKIISKLKKSCGDQNDQLFNCIYSVIEGHEGSI